MTSVYAVVGTIQLVYFEMNSMIVMESMLLTNPVEIKDHVLNKLNVHRQGDETAVQAWGRYLHKLNDLPFTQSWHPAIMQAVQDNRGAFLFWFFLS